MQSFVTFLSVMADFFFLLTVDEGDGVANVTTRTSEGKHVGFCFFNFFLVVSECTCV